MPSEKAGKILKIYFPVCPLPFSGPSLSKKIVFRKNIPEKQRFPEKNMKISVAAPPGLIPRLRILT